MTYFIPDSILEELRSGVVDHLEYDGPEVTAFFADGYVTHFNATATPEMITADRQQIRESARAHGALIWSGTMRVTVDDERHGMVFNHGV
jgi:hypothetical protein